LCKFIFEKPLTFVATYVIIYTVRGKPITASGQDEKGGLMEGMTNEQFKEYKETLIRLILEKLKNSKDLNEAIKKIEALLNE
jgi:hypothetical protein